MQIPIKKIYLVSEKAVSGIADVLCLCFSGSDIKIVILDPADHYTQTSLIEFN